MKTNSTGKNASKKIARYPRTQRTAFGERLFSITRSKKMTLKELGEKIGISNRMVTYYGTNEMGPPLDILNRMAEALGVTVAYLVNESPLKIVKVDDVSPAIKKDIEDFKSLPRKDQRTISNTISGLMAKIELQQKK